MEDLELLDIADDLLIINKTTIERLFNEESQNPLILYMFYYKTAKWQNVNPIKASDDYCKKCLHWGIDKLQSAKQKLKEMELIETIRRTDETGKVVGWYVKINYLIEKTRIPETTIPSKPQVVKQETNTNNNKYINTNNNKSTISRKRFKKPSLEEIKDYCLQRNNNVDAQKFFDYYEVNNWSDSKGNKVKSWKQKVITWETREPKQTIKEDIRPSWLDMDL